MRRGGTTARWAAAAGFIAVTAAGVSAGVPAYDHVVIVIEENHAYSQIIGSSAAPYINNTLLAQGANLTQMYGEEHHSQGNYFWLFSGSNQNVGYNDPGVITPALAAPNLGGALIARGLTFKGYSEDLPAIGSTLNTSGAYAAKHNPWVSFASVPNGTTVATSSNLRWTDFPSDYTQLPTVSIVVPNQNNDMHNGSDPTTITTADTWISSHLDGYSQWSKTHNSLLILTFDEDQGSTAGLTTPPANRIATIFAGANIIPGTYAEGTGVTHVNLLRTLESAYGLTPSGAQLSTATTAGIGNGAITDVFVPEPGSLALLGMGAAIALRRRGGRRRLVAPCRKLST